MTSLARIGRAPNTGSKISVSGYSGSDLDQKTFVTSPWSRISGNAVSTGVFARSDSAGVVVVGDLTL